MRILIVAEYASAQFGGEAILPLHYFRKLRSRGVEAILVVQDRTKEHLQTVFPHEQEYIHFIPDNSLHIWLHKVGQHLSPRMGSVTTGMLSYLYTQMIQRRVVRRLVKAHQIDIVHQPVPVSPKQPSLMFDLGAPVVIGPMNGGMNFPPAFRSERSSMEKAILTIGRGVARWVNTLLPGKQKASVLLVSNPRTRAALPKMSSKARSPRVLELTENGVDLDLWQVPTDSNAAQSHSAMQTRLDELQPESTQFVFIGRLVDWKAVDLLLQAFQPIAAQTNARLEIIGEGVMRPALETLTANLGLSDRVTFRGWLSQPDCAASLQQASALILPSLYECGGAVVLEAMAMGRPVIATNWGGPADYVDETCGILVNPTSRPEFIAGLTAAMLRLANSPELRESMGKAGFNKVRQQFSWDSKVDRILEIYKLAMKSNQAPIKKPAKLLSAKVLSAK
jgi:glycosyltransferase involved in cell wall biosynthesis